MGRIEKMRRRGGGQKEGGLPSPSENPAGRVRGGVSSQEGKKETSRAAREGHERESHDGIMDGHHSFHSKGSRKVQRGTLNREGRWEKELGNRPAE